jgi:hypothetical protein
MSWQRAPAAAALAELLTEASEGTVACFAVPPQTINPPAIVVSRPVTEEYGVAGMSVDRITLPVVCVGPRDNDDVVEQLKRIVLDAILADPTIKGAVQVATATEARNWRMLSIAGIETLAVDVILTVQM